MLTKNEVGEVMASTLWGFTAWRNHWRTAVRNWEDARRSTGGRNQPKLTDPVILNEPVRVASRSPLEGRIEFAVPREDAATLAAQDPQFSPDRSLDGALVNFFTIVDPEHLHPTGRERAMQTLRASAGTFLPGNAPWGVQIGGGLGFLGSSWMTVVAEIAPTFWFATLAAGTVGGAAIGFMPRFFAGDSERVLGAKFVGESPALYLAARAWITTVELRRHTPDGEADLTGNQMRRILWDAAGYINKHDRDVAIDFSHWAKLVDELEAVNATLDELLDLARAREQQPPSSSDADSIESHRGVLRQNRHQLDQWLTAASETRKDEE